MINSSRDTSKSISSKLNIFRLNLHCARGLRRFIELPQNLFLKLKWAYQRISKGYCDYDVYSLDIFYANLFVESLRELARVEVGYPGYYDEKYSNLTSEEKLQLWKDKINLIADSFVIDEEDYFISRNKYVKKFKNGFKMLEENFTELWW